MCVMFQRFEQEQESFPANSNSVSNLHEVLLNGKAPEGVAVQEGNLVENAKVGDGLIQENKSCRNQSYVYKGYNH